MSFLARSFSAVLFNSPDPLEEPMPSIDDDFMIALWSICREITHEVTKVRSKPVTPAAKPWSKERFVPVSKFTKGNFCLLTISLHFFEANPKSVDELSNIVVDELKALLTSNSPHLDPRILRKMGSKSKKDRVDLLLISELREEEKAWTQERLNFCVFGHFFT